MDARGLWANAPIARSGDANGKNLTLRAVFGVELLGHIAGAGPVCRSSAP